MSVLSIHSLAAVSPSAVAPEAPRDIPATGIPFGFLIQLVCKILFNAGHLRLPEIAGRLKLPWQIAESLLDFLRGEHLCEITSASSPGQRLYTLTQQGRQRAEEYLRISQYCGPAPVTLAAYSEQCSRQSVAGMSVRPADLQHALAPVVVGAPVIDQFGTALNSGRAIFVHGPAGAGKSFLVEHLANVMNGDVFLPYAVLVQDQVIQIHDANVHTAASTPSRSQCEDFRPDARWVHCRRPAVICGGELSLDMLDLRFDHGTRFYCAPPQLKANCGLLIIDDLGRQRMSAAELMNRWIVPLDRGRDYLTLHTGDKFCVPFDLVLVFCTNLSPQQLGDEAFLRRLGYKIGLGPLDAQQYRELCRRVAASLDITASDSSIESLIARFRAEGRPMLACTPRDLLGQARDWARYSGSPSELTPQLIDWAWRNYFAPPAEQPIFA